MAVSEKGGFDREFRVCQRITDFQGRHFLHAFIMHCSILPIAANHRIASASRRLQGVPANKRFPSQAQLPRDKRIAPPPIPEQQSDWFPPRNATNTRTELEKSRRASSARGSPATDFIGLQALKRHSNQQIEHQANMFCPLPASPRCPAPPLPTQPSPQSRMHPHTQLIRRTLGIQFPGAASTPARTTQLGSASKFKEGKNSRKQRETAQSRLARSMALRARTQF